MKLFIINLLAATLSIVLAQRCEAPDTFIVNGTCQIVECLYEHQCYDYAKYCNEDENYGIICYMHNGSSKCHCRGKWSGDSYGNGSGCNRALNGNDKCKPGEVCPPGMGAKCIPDPKCSFFGEDCDTQGCCQGQGFCHLRNGFRTKSCLNTAFVGEDCSSGISCDGESKCVNGKCSLGVDMECDGSDLPCPPGFECAQVPMDTGHQKECRRINL